MAQRPTHRLNLYLVPTDPERSLDEAALARGLERLRGEGVLAGWGPGPAAARLVPGGFALLRVDRPPGPALYGNRQGGYRARCPDCGENLVPLLYETLVRWRAGGGRGLRCPSCLRGHNLESIQTAPLAAPGRFALELREVEAPSTAGEARPLLEEVMGGRFLVVPSRG